MLEAIFPAGINEITVEGLTQWDRGQILRVSFPDMPTIYQVHFAFKGGREALIVHVLDGATSNDVEIPDELLMQPHDLIAYVYLIGSDGSGETVKTVNLPLERRAKPEDYTSDLTPTQAERIDAMLAEIHEQANSAVETAEDANTKATNAVNTANAAANTASGAKTAAESASSAAENSATAASTAQRAAENAAAAAANSATDASNAQRAAEEAENAAKQTAADWDAENAALVQYINNAFQTVGGEAITLTKIAKGNYTGTGTYGSSNKKSLTFSFVPKILIVLAPDKTTQHMILINGMTSSYVPGITSKSLTITSAWSGNTVNWYNADSGSLQGAASHQMNASATVYHYIALG